MHSFYNLIKSLFIVCVIAGAAAAQTLQAPDAARQAFRNMGFGMFIHFGAYSQMAAGEWAMEHQKIPIVNYEQVVAGFNPTLFDAKAIARTAKKAGMGYITITTRHHDGFCLFASKYTDYDVADRTPLKRDLIKEMADACQAEGVKLCLYYSLLDWHHPDYYPRGKTGGGYTGRPDSGRFERYVTYMQNQLNELLTGYGPIAAIWFDGEWDAPSKPWRFAQTYDIIHKLQPNCLVGNNHHASNRPGEDFQMFEQDLPGGNSHGFIKGENVIAKNLPLETCETMNNSWGFSATDSKFKSVRQLQDLLLRAAALNANLLLNNGLTGAGLIQRQCADTLAKLGPWVAANRSALFGQHGLGIYSWGTLMQTCAYVLVDEPTAVVLPLSATAKLKRILFAGPDKPVRPVAFERTKAGVVFTSLGPGQYRLE